MNYQIERIHATRADRLRAAERYRVVRMLPRRSIWTRLAAHLDRHTIGAPRSGAVGVAVTSTHRS